MINNTGELFKIHKFLQYETIFLWSNLEIKINNIYTFLNKSDLRYVMLKISLTERNH